jgi:hypothetical protein
LVADGAEVSALLLTLLLQADIVIAVAAQTNVGRTLQIVFIGVLLWGRRRRPFR